MGLGFDRVGVPHDICHGEADHQKTVPVLEFGGPLDSSFGEALPNPSERSCEIA